MDDVTIMRLKNAEKRRMERKMEKEKDAANLTKDEII